MISKILSGIDSIHQFFCRLFVNTATFFLIIMTIIIVIQVCLRYFFGSPLAWSEEVAVYLMLWMAYLCLPYLVYSNQNISMTFLSDRFKGTKIQYILEIFYVMFIVFTGVVWYPYAILSVKNGFLVTLTQIPLNMGIVLSIIPVSLLLMITIALQKLIVSLCCLIYGKHSKQTQFFKPFLQDLQEELQ
ncbi:MAG: TRAP transporter small permease [Brevinema sp.]